VIPEPPRRGEPGGPACAICAGATTPAALVEVKRMGYASVINLRQASEPGAEIEASAAAAKAAGLNYIHIPFNAASPDSMAVDNFLKAVTDRANQPAFIHCAAGIRAGAFWMIRRVLRDGWTIEAAEKEAEKIGLRESPHLNEFARRYIEKHRRKA